LLVHISHPSEWTHAVFNLEWNAVGVHLLRTSSDDDVEVDATSIREAEKPLARRGETAIYMHMAAPW